MTAVTCRCGRVCASRSGYATHARTCAVCAAWNSVAYAPGTEKVGTYELWARADVVAQQVVREGDELLAQVVERAARKELTPRGVRRFADLHEQFDANELLTDLVAVDGVERANLVVARFDQLLAEQSLTSRLRDDALQF